MENKQLTETRGDFTTEELNILEQYKANKYPGLQRITESDVFQWYELYISGKTYTEIAKLTSSKKELILYTSDKANWHEKKLKYYADISDRVIQKYMQCKLESVNTVTNMVSALNGYFSEKFNKYQATKDKAIIEGIDTKLLAQYYKANEMIDEFIMKALDKDDNKKKSSPTININVGGSANQKPQDIVEVVSTDAEKDLKISEILGNLSNIKKIRESQN